MDCYQASLPPVDGEEKAAEPLASCLPKWWGVFECMQWRMSLPGVVLGYGIKILGQSKEWDCRMFELISTIMDLAASQVCRSLEKL